MSFCYVFASELTEKVLGEDQRAFPILLELANHQLDTVSINWSNQKPLDGPNKVTSCEQKEKGLREKEVKKVILCSLIPDPLSWRERERESGDLPSVEMSPRNSRFEICHVEKRHKICDR